MIDEDTEDAFREMLELPAESVRWPPGICRAKAIQLSASYLPFRIWVSLLSSHNLAFQIWVSLLSVPKSN